jgi:putative ABC transport system permease protein
MWRRRTPLARLNLLHSKPRLLAATGGVAFAAVLMFLETGFLNGMYDTETHLVTQLNADLFILNKDKQSILPKLPFPRTRLVQARACAGVDAAYPLYLEERRGSWKNARDRRDYPLLVVAFDPNDPVFLIPEVTAHARELLLPDTALLDSRSRDFYGDIAAGSTGELSGYALRIVGTFPLGPDLRVDGNLIVSERTFFKCFANRSTGTTEASKVELGLLKVTEGVDPGDVRNQLVRALPDDVRVLTKQEFIDVIKTYWGTTKPIGHVFGLGTVVGFLIGVTICYQILYTGIVDRLPQYATLKAIGYSEGFLVKVVLQEALYLAMLGFLVGLGCSVGIYAGLQAVSGMRMQLTVPRAALLLGLTMLMCALSALIAVRKALRSDPAEIF